MNLIIKLLITAAIAYLCSNFLSGIHVNNFSAALIFAVVFGLVNAIIKPILTFLTLPISVVTLGLFLLVINALMVLLTDKLMDSVKIDGFWWALLFSLILSFGTSVLEGLFTGKKD